MIRDLFRKYTVDLVISPGRIVARRPAGTDADVDHLHTTWQRLWDLDCGHDHECDDYLERNQAVNDAIERVSVRQEGQAFRRLTPPPRH
jgi:hypothetical protein